MDVCSTEATPRVPVCTSEAIKIRELSMLLWPEPRGGQTLLQMAFQSLTLLITASEFVIVLFLSNGSLKTPWSFRTVRNSHLKGNMNQNEECIQIHVICFLLAEVSHAFLVLLQEGMLRVIASTEKHYISSKAASLTPELLSWFSIQFYQVLLCPHWVCNFMSEIGKMMAVTIMEVEIQFVGL